MLWPDENQMKTYSQPERLPFTERALAQMSEKDFYSSVNSFFDVTGSPSRTPPAVCRREAVRVSPPDSLRLRRLQESGSCCCSAV
jgi:hypothetical protein